MKATAAVRAPLRIHLEHLRQKPSPRDPVPILAAPILVIVVFINDRQLQRLGHDLRPEPMRGPEHPVVSHLILTRRRDELSETTEKLHRVKVHHPLP